MRSFLVTRLSISRVLSKCCHLVPVIYLVRRLLSGSSGFQYDHSGGAPAIQRSHEWSPCSRQGLPLGTVARTNCRLLP